MFNLRKVLIPSVLVVGLLAGTAVGLEASNTAILTSASTTATPVVYIASGEKFPDALAGGPAAAHGNGPILLVAPDAIPSATATELTRLVPEKIVILGGELTVSVSVQTALEAYTDGEVVRISGANRYETAVAISQEYYPLPAAGTAFRVVEEVRSVPVSPIFERTVVSVACDPGEQPINGGLYWNDFTKWTFGGEQFPAGESGRPVGETWEMPMLTATSDDAPSYSTFTLYVICTG